MTNPDRWLGVEMRHLIALEAISEERSFSKAARRLGYTQSAISQQLALLERLVGERLVERPGGPSPVSLSPAGEILLRHAHRIVAQLAAAQADLSAWSAGGTGHLRIGTYHSAGAKILPAVIGRFAASFPEVTLDLVELPNEGELLTRVRNGELDLTFMLYPLAEGPFQAVELLEDPFMLLIEEGAPLARRGRPPTLREISSLPLISYGDVRDVTRPESRLASASVVFRSNDDETIHGLVAIGMGAALLPRLSVDPGHPGVVAIELGTRLPPRVIGLAWHADRDLPPAAREFIATTGTVCRELAGRRRERSRMRLRDRAEASQA